MDDNYFTDDSKIKNQVSIYPNPSNGNFTIENSNFDEDILSVEIYNSSGVKVYNSGSINSPTYNINLSGQPKGLYLIRVNNSTEIRTDRIIIN